MGVPKVIEDEITIDTFDEFYGDIVEYDIYKATETVIGNIYHRFNTAQREIWNLKYKDIKQDVIIADDYDVDESGNTKGFECTTYFVNNVKNPMSNDKNSVNLMYGNIMPEGYFYNPHMKIQIKENDRKEMTSPAKNINYDDFVITEKKSYLLFKKDGSIEVYDNIVDASMNKTDEDDYIIQQNAYYEIEITAPINYGFYKGDYIAFYDKETSNIVWGEITGLFDTTLYITVAYDDFGMVDYVSDEMFNPRSGSRRFYAYWSPNNVPLYAKLCEPTKQFIWRKLINPSEVLQDGETYNTPFVNGGFYVEKNFNFFLKRQDPNGKYGLSEPLHRIYEGGVTNPMTRFAINGRNPIDLTDFMTLNNNDNSNCF
jgi:hypothetical protein